MPGGSGGGQPNSAYLEEALDRFGIHSACYVLLEGNKSYLRGGDGGFVAWERRFGCPVIAGDPVCEVADATPLLLQLRRRFRPRPVFAYAVSARMVEAFRSAGFACVPVGAEPIFDPSSFALAGGARATLRAAVNHATKAGVRVSEHFPRAPGAALLNNELEALSAEWLSAHGNGELSFLLGLPRLGERTRKRYFVARSAQRVEGFMVCEPIPASGGWYIDVTRRRVDALRGTMELLSTTAMRAFGVEGVRRVSMGLAPLARLDLGASIADDSPSLRLRFERVFNEVRSPYGFESLARYKTKYAPDSWEPAFFCLAGAGAGLVMDVALRWLLMRTPPPPQVAEAG
ncbi:MAG: phosphatidylglycerol lysyltransferase domain-containing protein [Gemmatimonadota bacterium]